jgi:hypothetical protein
LFPGTSIFYNVLDKYKVSKEHLMTDFSVMQAQEKLQYETLDRYNLTNVNSGVLKFYRYLYQEAIHINRLRNKGKWILVIIEIVLLFWIKSLIRLAEIVLVGYPVVDWRKMKNKLFST